MSRVDVAARLLAKLGLPADEEAVHALATDLDEPEGTAYADTGTPTDYLMDPDISASWVHPASAELAGDAAPATLLDARREMRAGRVSSEELVSAAVRSAEGADARLGVYISERWQHCLEAAIRKDAAGGGEDAGSLDGIPMVVKDNIRMAGTVTTAQSMVLPRNPGRSDADVVGRLRQEGALILGKASMGEFAVGLPDESQPFPYPRNPWDPSRYPGGSSSGSGIGVAAGFFYAALGTDTAGSVRMPAALCGVSGLKPTYGTISNAGVVPLAPSLDTVGVLATSAADCALVTSVLSPSPPEALGAWVSDRLQRAQRADALKLDNPCIGYDDRLLHSPLADPAAGPAFDQFLSTLAGAGVQLTPLQLPLTKELHQASMVTMRAEGFHQHRTMLGSHWARYTPSARTELIRGALVSRSAYTEAQATRRRGVDLIHELLRDYSCLITPTMSIGAPLLPEVSWQITDTMLTSIWNATGVPAISIPIGFTAAGLPLAAQIAAGPFEEAAVIEVADCFQRLTEWHLRRPSIDTRSQGDRTTKE